MRGVESRLARLPREPFLRTAIDGDQALRRSESLSAQGVRSLVAVPQPADGVSLAGKITVADAAVPWSAPGRHVDRLIRACTPAPGAWTRHRSERIKLGPVRLRGTTDLAPGELAVARNSVAVGTGRRAVELGWVQPPGRRPMPAPDWARGARIEPGEQLS